MTQLEIRFIVLLSKTLMQSLSITYSQGSIMEQKLGRHETRPNYTTKEIEMREI